MMHATAEITLPRLHPAQLEVYRKRKRFTVLNCGRRWGKSRFAAGLCIQVAAAGGVVWIVAPTYEDAGAGWEMVMTALSGLPVTINKSERRARFPSGGYIHAKSADRPEGLRGRGLKLVVIDEAAFIPSSEVWTKQLRPALSDKLGDALFISTPNGRNWFWGLYQQAIADSSGEWAAFTMPTSSNPYILPSEIEAARAMLPDAVFRQEYLAEFIEDGAGVFRNVSELATLQPLAGPRAGAHYVCGVDVATEKDFTVAVVMDAATGDMVYMDRFNRCTFPELEDRLHALYHRWKVQTMLIEVNSIGRGVIDHLRARDMAIVEFQTTATTKTPLIQGLQTALEHREIRLLADSVLIAELQAYEGERMASGMRYGAPANMHDDTVIGLALANRARGSRLQVF
jgi:phage FluMu gp28-like protein